MRTLRLLNGVGRRIHILELSVSSDWKSRTPWSYKGETLPYFFCRQSATDFARVNYVGIGPFVVRWAYAKRHATLHRKRQDEGDRRGMEAGGMER